ncbi:MAG: hypothetical protein ACHQ02_08615 [Candidatus Limnocylindrales bacterium]
MSDGFGIGDGAFDLSVAQGQAEAAVADARRARPDSIGVGRWPGIGAVLRAMLAIGLTIVLLGWVLTALNA